MKICKKTLLALSLVGILSNSVIADEVEAEIAKLKKENELLELQKRNKDLKKDKDSNASIENADGSSVFNGWFVGAELLVNPKVETYRWGVNSGAVSDSTFAIPFNLAFGYLYYPWANAGFKFKGYAGYANYDNTITKNGMKGTLKSQAIHYGLEAEYRYDFVSSAKHTFGLNIGTGYEFGTFIAQGIDYVKKDFPSYTASSWTSALGVHYYYKIHHQFEIKYRYRTGYALGEGGEANIDLNTGTPEKVKYSTTPNSSIIFAYNYKF